MAQPRVTDQLNAIPQDLTLDQTIAAPFSVSSWRTAAAGQPSSPPTVLPNGSETERRYNYDAMISYSWKDSDIVRPLVDKLARLNFRLWIDVNRMRDDVNESIIAGITQSAVVIPFLSDHYVASHCCKLEIKFANELQKPILPVRLANSSAVKLSAAAFITAGQLYIDLENGVSSETHEILAARLSRMLLSGLNAITLSQSDVKVNESDGIIGSGSFGNVYIGEFHGRQVAVKRLKLGKLGGKAQDELIAEARMLQNSRHPYIIGCYGIVAEDLAYSLVLEFASLGNLFDYYQNPMNESTSARARVTILYQVATGMAFLHDKMRILHNDLKSMNVLLTRHNADGPVFSKITDFGLSKLKTETRTKSTSSTAFGSALWMAPERKLIRPKVSNANDVFSFAVLLTEVVSWIGVYGMDWDGLDVQGLLEALKSESERQVLLEQLDDDVFSAVSGGLKLGRLFRECWSWDLTSRPSFAEISLTLRALLEGGEMDDSSSGFVPRARGHIETSRAEPSVTETNVLRQSASVIIDVCDESGAKFVAALDQGDRDLVQLSIASATVLSIEHPEIKLQFATTQLLAKALPVCKLLQGISLRNNGLRPKEVAIISEALKLLPSLRTIDFGGNNIGDDGAKAVAEIVETSKTLESLCLESPGKGAGVNRIGPVGAKALARSIKVNSSLKLLSLGWNRVGEGGALEIADALRSSQTLQSLSLKWNRIGTDGAKAIAVGLKQSRSLLSIDLIGNEMGTEGAIAIAEALKSTESLKEIELEFNHFGLRGTAALCQALKENASLWRLNLARNYFGPEAAQSIADVICTNSSLRFIDISDNQIGVSVAATSLHDFGRKLRSTTGVKAIAEALRLNRTLYTINLRANELGHEGAKVIAEAIKSNTSLRSIDLGWNGMGVGGADSIGDALRHNPSIQAMELGRNNFGYGGVYAIVSGLTLNTNLRRLGLGGNSIGDKEAKLVAQLIKLNSTISEIDISRNEIGPDGARALADALQANASLIDIRLERNEIGDEGAVAFARLLTGNQTLRRVNLELNRIGTEGAKAVTNAAKAKTPAVEIAV